MFKKSKKSNGLVDMLKREPPKSNKRGKFALALVAVGGALAAGLSKTKKAKP